MDPSLNQIMNEYQDLQNNPIASIGACVGLSPNDPNNMRHWQCTLTGPQDSSYAGGLFYLDIKFPMNYPQVAPEVKFLTPIYHINVNHMSPNMYPLGHICMSTLFYWQPYYRIREVIANIFNLFYLGNPDSPYGVDRQDEMLNRRQLYEEKIRYFTQKYARFDQVVKEYDHWDFTYNPNPPKNSNIIINNNNNININKININKNYRDED